MGASIKSIKEQLRSVPDKGVGYGLLRYLAGDEVGAQLAGLATPRITFNYLGQFDRQFDEGALFAPAAESAGVAQDENAPLANWLSIEGQVYGGELNLQWTYSHEMFDDATVQALVDDYRRELSALITHCVNCEQGGMTPSDFPLAQLTQAQLDNLNVPANAIEDIYPLSPMQQGLLVHTLLEPGSGIYFMQDRYIIDSEIDLPRFTAAWHAVVQRHDALRASFSLDDDGHMLQIIHRDAAPNVQVHDWTERAQSEHESALQTLLSEDRAQGFDLLNTPPLSLRLIRRSAGHYWFILSNHHILIDAWCRSLLLQGWDAAIKPNTKLLFVESPSNPLAELVDITALAEIAHAKGALLVVDNCFCTPALQQPVKLGADIVVHSATKFIDGQGRCMGGVVAGRSELMKEVVGFLRTAGPTLSPFNAWIFLKGLETLSLRMKAHCANAQARPRRPVRYSAASPAHDPPFAVRPNHPGRCVPGSLCRHPPATVLNFILLHDKYL